MSILTQPATTSCNINPAILFANCPSSLSPRSQKCLDTAKMNGRTLLSDGYAFVRDEQIKNLYYCANPSEAIVYAVRITSREITCDCGGCEWLGCCKHCISLFENKAEIDAQNDAREAEELRLAEARQRVAAIEAARPAKVDWWDGWTQFFDEIDAKAANEAEQYRKAV